MTKLYNEIVINAPLESVWEILSSVDQLQNYDPTVQRSKATTRNNTGVGASRRVDMKDGEHWFEERTTLCRPNEALQIELTACNFPIDGLRHSYTFEHQSGQTKVKQVMEYDVKYGVLGKLMDALVLRKRTDVGIKKFFAGLKEYAERK